MLSFLPFLNFSLPICDAGPGSYNPKLPPSSNGGRFGGMRPKTAVDWEIYRASQLPGPSDYNAPGTIYSWRRGERARVSTD